MFLLYSMEFVISVVGSSVSFPSWKNPLTKLPRKFRTGRFVGAFGRNGVVVAVVGVLPDADALHLYIAFNF